MKFLIILIILIIINLNYNCYGYGESDSQGNPNSQERESHNLINLVRMFPTQYKANYMSGYSGTMLGSMYPSVKPIYMDNVLNRMSKAHSADMAINGCFSHNDCVNSSSTSARFSRWQSCSGNWGENIAAGYATGIATNNQLICDSTTNNKVCTPDGSGSDGHRSNIMKSGHRMMGVGYYYVTTSYKYYWTQDFTACANVPTHPIYSAYHTFYPSTTIPQFIAMFYSTSTTVTSMKLVIIGGTNQTMSLTYGNSSFAAFTYTPTTFNSSKCQQYYFQSTTADGKNYRYPDTGYLQVSSNPSTCLAWSSNLVSSSATASVQSFISFDNIKLLNLENEFDITTNTNNSSIIKYSIFILLISLLISLF